MIIVIYHSNYICVQLKYSLIALFKIKFLSYFNAKIIMYEILLIIYIRK